MEELYSIMRDLLEVEYNQASLLHILETLEATYSEEQKEARWIANSAKYYLAGLQSDIKEAISQLDQYLVNQTGLCPTKETTE